MLKKTVTFINFDGVQETQDLYFHFSKAEILEMHANGLANTLDSVVTEAKKTDSRNAEDLVKLFKRLMGMAYGERSPDGRGFKKSEEISAYFLNSPAFDELFMELVEGGVGDIIDFVSRMFPPDMTQSVVTEAQKQGFTVNIPDASTAHVITDLKIPEPKSAVADPVPAPFAKKIKPIAEMSTAEIEAYLASRKSET